MIIQMHARNTRNNDDPVSDFFDAAVEHATHIRSAAPQWATHLAKAGSRDEEISYGSMHNILVADALELMAWACTCLAYDRGDISRNDFIDFIDDLRQAGRHTEFPAASLPPYLTEIAATSRRLLEWAQRMTTQLNHSPPECRMA